MTTMILPKLLPVPPVDKRAFEKCVLALVDEAHLSAQQNRQPRFFEHLAKLLEKLQMADSFRLLAYSDPYDVSATLIAHLPENVRQLVNDHFGEHEDDRKKLLAGLTFFQALLRDEYEHRASQGDAQALKVLPGGKQ